MKEIINYTLCATFVMCSIGAVLQYFAPHSQCVRAQVADKTHPMTEADAHLECGRWMRSK